MPSEVRGLAAATETNWTFCVEGMIAQPPFLSCLEDGHFNIVGELLLRFFLSWGIKMRG